MNLLPYLSLLQVTMDFSPEKSFSDPMMLGKPRASRVYKAGQQTVHFPFNRSPSMGAAHVSTYSDRFRWLHDGWERLKPTMKDRLIRNLLLLVTTSSFTGMGCCEIIFYLIIQFVNTKLAKPLPYVSTLSCCDVDPHTPVVLSSFERHARPIHMHGNITDRWTSQLWEEVEKLKPKSSDYVEAKRMRMKLVEQTIMQQYDNSAGSMMSAPCSFHDGCCHIVDRDYSRYIGGHMQSLTEIRFNSAGIPCDDITNMGNREGDAGQTAIIHAAWVAERRVFEEDIILVECSKEWNADHLTTRLQDSHSICTCIVRSGETGDLVDRARKVGVCLRNTTARFLCVLCCGVS